MTAALLTDLSLAEAALIAAILAPTDAALGEAVISNPAVPNVIRQSLNVESGLNDGLIVPVVAIFVTLAIGHELDEPATLVARALGEVGLALVVGALVAVVLARVITVATRRSLTSDAGLRLVGFGGALAAFAGSTAIGGNGFVAAFGCGLVARYLIGESVTDHTELVEDLSHVGASATFVLFGAVLVWPALQDATPLVFLCAIATLTLGRMVPVALAMLGSGFKVQTVAFVGWFGPRGLASMLFGLLLVAEGELEVADELFSVIALVVLLSVFLHGASAWRGAVKYGNWYASMSEDETMMESMECESTPVRWRRLSE